MVIKGLGSFRIYFVLCTAVFAAAAQLNEENLQRLHLIEQSIDPEVEPCDDFYNYACGNFKAGSLAVDEEGIVNYLLQVMEVMQREYHPEDMVKTRQGQHYAVKPQIYWESCLRARDNSLLPFLEELKPATGVEWPLVEQLQSYEALGKFVAAHNWSTHKVNIPQLLGKMFGYGMTETLISINVHQAQVDVYVKIDIPSPLTIEIEDLQDIFAKTRLPTEIMHKFYAEFLDTHQKWQQIYKEYSKNPQDYKTSKYDQLRIEFPHFATFFDNMVAYDTKIDNMTVVYPPNYVKFLFSKRWSPLQSQQLSNYLMFQFLLSLKDFPTELYCVTSMLDRFELALNYIYYQHYYLREATQTTTVVTDMAQKLYEHYMAALAENHLKLKQFQLQEIHERLKQMSMNLGNLPNNKSEALVMDFYSNLPDMDPLKPYRNELYLRQHSVAKPFICPPDTMCRNEFQDSLMYHKLSNLVTVSFMSLTKPRYHWSLHPLFALSAMGFSMAHEYGHAIDLATLDQFNLYVFPGGAEKYSTIRAAAECLRAQTASADINERLADIIGVHVAYRTYSHEYGEQPNFTTIPWQQLFFLNVAQDFCAYRNAYSEDNHGADSLRVQVIVKNSKQFAQAFKCPKGSNMNPVEKCRYI